MPKSIVLFVLSFVLIPNLTWAEDSALEMGHLLSIGAGISSPSLNSALGENPAGLTYNEQTRLLLDGATTNSNSNSIGLGASLLGDGNVGAGFGVETFNGQGDNAGQITLANIGVAAEIPSLNVSFGMTGTYTLRNNVQTIGTGSSSGNGYENHAFDADMGVIYNPKGDVRMGATLFQIFDGVDALGVGVAATRTAGRPLPWMQRPVQVLRVRP